MDAEVKTGGPAFPAHHFDLAMGEHGMTLRDYFAAKAIEGYAVIMATNMRVNPDLIAADAYNFADAMLAAREQ